MTALILNWQQAFEAGVLSCGGKGYHLAKLQRYGFPVPPGGVVVADVYRQLIHAPALAACARALALVPAEDVMQPSVQERLLCLQRVVRTTYLHGQIGAEIERFLHDCDLANRPLAVRSSAVSEDGPNASFAGIHQSVLHVHGVEAICDAILTCFASLWTPQALAYRRRMAFADDDVLCAVVLCAMVTVPGAQEPQSAGVAFSCDPRTGRRDLIVINAARGPGERVVSGAVDSGSGRVASGQGRLHRYSCETRGTPVLTPAQEQELAHHVWRIHWALGEGDDPQDVEWAYDGEQFWILQSRPVTGLPRYTFEAIRHLPVIWSTANIKEAVPGVVSMFAWSMIQEEIDAILYAGPRRWGVLSRPACRVPSASMGMAISMSRRSSGAGTTFWRPARTNGGGHRRAPAGDSSAIDYAAVRGSREATSKDAAEDALAYVGVQPSLSPRLRRTRDGRT